MQARRITPATGLMNGRPYTRADATDVTKTWLAAGWIPPSREAQLRVFRRLNPSPVPREALL
jgi:hypothetical protein